MYGRILRIVTSELVSDEPPVTNPAGKDGCVSDGVYGMLCGVMVYVFSNNFQIERKKVKVEGCFGPVNGIPSWKKMCVL